MELERRLSFYRQVLMRPEVGFCLKFWNVFSEAEGILRGQGLRSLHYVFDPGTLVPSFFILFLLIYKIKHKESTMLPRYSFSLNTAMGHKSQWNCRHQPWRICIWFVEVIEMLECVQLGNWSLKSGMKCHLSHPAPHAPHAPSGFCRRPSVFSFVGTRPQLG